VLSRIDSHDEVNCVLIHLDRLGRLNLTGAMALRSLLQELELSAPERSLTASSAGAAVDEPASSSRNHFH